jgi:hypothetical protein
MKRLTEFEWECCDDGYIWRGSVLVPASPSRSRFTPPISGAGQPGDEMWRDVFLIFSDTKPTPAGIQSFAMLYGLLGIPTVAVRRRTYSTRLARALGVRRPQTIQEHGEPLANWVAEIRDMKRVIRLYLNKQYAEFWSLMNEKLSDTVAPRFTLNGGGLNLIPKNLLGFMWLQLGLKSRGRWILRECRVCREPMAVREMGKRPSRLTDKASCRVTLSNLRKDYRDGLKSLAEIARRLRTDANTARRWMEAPVSETGRVVKHKRRV